MHAYARAVGERDGEKVQRASVAGKPELAGGQFMPRLVVPQIRCDAARHPQPAVVVSAAAIVAAEGAQRLLELGLASGVVLLGGRAAV